MNKYVLIVGSFGNGVRIVGEFDSTDEAIEYAEVQEKHEHWELAPLEAPAWEETT
jgi:hypothetical protein